MNSAPAPGRHHSHDSRPHPRHPDAAGSAGHEDRAARPGGLMGVLTGRRSAWVVLLLFVVIVAGVAGALRGREPVGGMNTLPAASESAEVKDLIHGFDNSGRTPAILVVTRTDGSALSGADQKELGALGARLAPEGTRPMGPIPSKDGKAAIIGIDVRTNVGSDEVRSQIDDLRAEAGKDIPSGLKVEVTGGPAFGVDVARAFDGTNFTLLAVTIGIVAVLLLATYRSPILWLLPLTVVALADQTSNAVTGALGQAWQLSFDRGVVSVLVFGAGTNYALLLVSRYREELRRHDDHRAAIRAAWRNTVPAVLASNLSVVISLLTLLLATMPSTRGLGIASAVGLLIALASVVLVLPAFLAVTGRGVFWPFVPRPGDESGEDSGFFGRLAQRVVRRPGLVVAGSVVVLAVLTCGMLGTRVGLTQMEQFASPNESSRGYATMSEHFDAGEAQPNTVVARKDATDEVVAAAKKVPGVVRVTPVASSGDLVRIQVVGDSEPESARSLQTVRDLRSSLASVPGADAKVGGANAEAVDIRDASTHDLVLIAPMIAGVAFLVLVVLLRSLVAPLILTVTNLASAAASIGAGVFIGRTVFGFPGLDVNVPLLSVLFLVALGIDYTIFLVHRARLEAVDHGTRQGMVRAVGRTGVVITSAGVVLAAVFAALGVLPLVVLKQLGLIVGLGVLIDTFFVRTVLVPALFALVGDRMWWPSHPVRHTDPTPA